MIGEPFGTPRGGAHSSFTPGRLSPVFWIDSVNVILNSGNVSKIIDLSGNGKHLSQSTANDQPEWVEATDDTNNWYPYVQFDGVSEYLGRSDSIMTGATPVTLFIVYKPLDQNESLFSFGGDYGTGSDGGCIRIVDQDTTDNRIYLSMKSRTSYWEDASLYDGGTAGIGTLLIPSSSCVDPATPSAYAPHWFTNGTKHLPDGGVAGALSLEDTHTKLGMSEDPSAFGTFDFFELLVFDKALNAYNRGRVESYLATKYNITLP